MRRPSGPREIEGPGPGPEGSGSGADASGRAGMARRLLLVAGGALGLVLAAYAAAAVLVHTLLDPTALSRWIEPRAEAALNRDVELEGARIRLFPSPGAELRGVRVANLPDFEGPPLVRVRSVRLQVALLPLFRRRIRVDEVRIDHPVVRLAGDGTGRTNYGDLVPQAEEPPGRDGGAPLRLAVREVAVRAGSVSWIRASDSVRVSLEGVEARAELERSPSGSWRGELSARSDSVLLRHPAAGSGPLHLIGPTVELRGRAADDFAVVEVREGRLGLGGAALRLTGRVERLREPVRRVDLALRARDLRAGRLLEMVPGSAARPEGRASGSLDVDLRLEGAAGPGRSPELRGEVTLASVGFRGPDGDVLVQDVGGRVQVGSGRVTVRDVGGTVLGGPFSVNGIVGTDSTAAVRGRVVARPRLDRAPALLGLAGGLDLAGRLDARIEVSGRLDRLEEAGVTGSVEASGLRVEHPALGVPATVPEARVAFEGRRAGWSGVDVELGVDRLTVAGSLENPLALAAPPGGTEARLALDVAGARLDLDAVLPSDVDPSVTYGKLAFAHLGGRPVEGRSPEAWAEERGMALPDSLPLVGEARIRLDTLLAPPHRITDLDARVAFAPDLLEVPEASFVAYGGSTTARLRLGAGEPPQPFTLEVRAAGMRAADVLEATSPLGRRVSGTLSLDLELAGEVNGRLLPVASALGGSARIRIREGGLRENPVTRALADALALPGLAAPSFSEWIAPIRLEGPRLHLADAGLTVSRVGPLRFGGAVGLDGSVDLGLRLAVSATRLDSLALGRSGLVSAVAGDWAGGEEALSLGLGVTGTLTDPRIGPRASLATGELRRALQADIEDRAGALSDTARARLEALRDSAGGRLGGVRDRARARLDSQRSRVEARAREDAEEARRELQERARSLLRGLGRREGDTVPSPDTAPGRPTGGESPPDTTGEGSSGPRG